MMIEQNESMNNTFEILHFPILISDFLYQFFQHPEKIIDRSCYDLQGLFSLFNEELYKINHKS